MENYFPLINTVMKYPWGSYDAIADLLGQKCPSPEPQAELWLGAHPKAPSVVETAGRSQRLDKLIQQFPREILGPTVADGFDNQMPFLLKVLSARQPLSIQAHPDADQARAGFENENSLGIPLDASERNYRDPNPKPECICALGEFWALCGFRPTVEIAGFLEKVAPVSLAEDIKLLNHQTGARALPSFFSKLLLLERPQRAALIAEALAAVDTLAGSSEMKSIGLWVRRIAADFPEDIGILAPAMLNLIRLEPGEALFLPAGSLHAYLSGTGIELMGSSDNVLRGGLTTKHVDADKLIQTLSFDAWQPEVLAPVQLDVVESYYPCPVREFRLSVLKVGPGHPFRSQAARSVEILLCTEGEIQILPAAGSADSIMIRRGKSILVPAAAPAYRITGSGVLYRASVPLEQ